MISAFSEVPRFPWVTKIYERTERYDEKENYLSQLIKFGNVNLVLLKPWLLNTIQTMCIENQYLWYRVLIAMRMQKYFT